MVYIVYSGRKDPEIKRTESNLKAMKEKLGENEFETPKAEEIRRKILK